MKEGTALLESYIEDFDSDVFLPLKNRDL